MQKCSNCLYVTYCGRECQTAHWKQHKPVCGAQARSLGPPPDTKKHRKAGRILMSLLSDETLHMAVARATSDPENFGICAPLPGHVLVVSIRTSPFVELSETERRLALTTAAGAARAGTPAGPTTLVKFTLLKSTDPRSAQYELQMIDEHRRHFHERTNIVYEDIESTRMRTVSNLVSLSSKAWVDICIKEGLNVLVVGEKLAARRRGAASHNKEADMGGA